MSSPDDVSCIVIACCVLHNIAIRNGIELDVPETEDLIGEDVNGAIDDDIQGNRPYQRGVRARNEIVHGFFTD